jgi:hypothetical protein
MMFAPKRSRNGVGMIAMFQAFALAVSLLAIRSHGLMGLVENLSRQENSRIRRTDYLGAFTVSRGSKSLDRQPAGIILAAELFKRKPDEAIRPIPNYAERTYRCGCFFISLIRSPPAIASL